MNPEKSPFSTSHPLPPSTLLPPPSPPGQLTSRSTSRQRQRRQPPPSVPSGSSKRKNVAIACMSCRRRKERCDGQRPTCGPCGKRNMSCSYAVVGGDPFRITPLKRSFEVLQSENEQWRELFSLIQKLPDAEVAQTLNRIRTSKDPESVLHFARSAVLASTPASNLEPFFKERNPKADIINMRALVVSPIKVNARPWTVIAGDGLVSELMASYFTWDHAFYFPFVDRMAILGDMSANDPKTSRYCSSFLVNAICTIRSVSLFLFGPACKTAH